MTQEAKVNAILLVTIDPVTSKVAGTPIPALTTLLHSTCGGDPTKFAEACRVVELFIARALEEPK